MSRLMLPYILSSIVFFSCRTHASAQIRAVPASTRKEIKRLERQVKKMSTDEKLLMFTIRNDHEIIDRESYNIVSNSNYKETSNPHETRIINLSTIKEIEGLPFPGVESRTMAKISTPAWLPAMFKSSFVVDLPENSTMVIWGLDSSGYDLVPTGYANPDHLISSYFEHDLVYLTRGNNLLHQLKPTPKEKKMLNAKVLEKLVSPASNILRPITPSKKMLANWLIRVYAAIDGIDIDKNLFSTSIANWRSNGSMDHAGNMHRLEEGPAELVGMDSLYLSAIDTLINRIIKERIIPGCQLLVARNGIIIKHDAYGYQTYDSLTAVTNSTIYDLASITKPLATTQALMLLEEDGQIDLNKPLSYYLSYLIGSNKEDITIKQILSHQAGLYPYYPFWSKVKNELHMQQMTPEVQVGKDLWVDRSVKDSLLTWAVRSDLLADRIDTITHEQYMYSDLGFYFLGDLVEKKTGIPMDEFLNHELYQPIGSGLRFNPLTFYRRENIAPTEKDELLRNELVRGYVHDRNAALMGGVAGQAGLFGTSCDVAILLAMHLQMGEYDYKEYLKPATVAKFNSRYFAGNRRGLGWDKPGTEPDGPISVLASDESFGHTGFTGGSVWVDPKENLIFVFLSNRVYPSVDNNELVDQNIRTRIQDLVYQSIIRK